MKNRITPSNIQTLNPGEVFVFGSNLSGHHAGGAARLAHEKFGALWGFPVGQQGSTYAIPTLDKDVVRTLTVDEIRPYVNGFIEYAKARPSVTYLVTEIGCGIAGHTPKDIAPLFEGALMVDNIHLPERFWAQILV